MSILSLNDEPVRERPVPTPRAKTGVSVTLILIGINVLLFIVMVASGVPFVSPTASQVLPWGADFGPLTASGQWWRLLTACFLHFGIIHIGMNMFILLQIGVFTERLFGRARFLALYLLAGIGGNIAGLYLHPFTVSAGASGAIFGLYGGLLAFLLVRRGIVPHAAAWGIARSAGLFLAYNLIYGLASPNTDMEAHIGGFITGFFFGAILAWSRVFVREFPGRQRISTAARACAAAAAATVAILASLIMLPKPEASQKEWYTQLAGGTFVPMGRSSHLIYSGSVTRSGAQNVAQALVARGFVGDQTILILTRNAAGTSLSMELKGDEKAPATSDHVTSKLVDGKVVIVHETETAKPLPWNDPEFLNTIRMIGPEIAEAAGGPPLTIRLLNSKGQLRQQIRIDASAIAFGADRVQLSGEATEQQARALGEALKAQGYFRGRGDVVVLTKSGAGTLVSFFASDNPTTVRYFQVLGQKIAPSIDGLPLRLEIIDPRSTVRKEILVQ